MTTVRPSALEEATTPSIGGRLQEQIRHSASAIGGIRIPEFLLFFLLVTYSVLPLPSGGIPWSNLIMAAIVGLALLRRPTRSLASVNWVIPVFVLGLFYVCMVSMWATPSEFAADWQGRALRIAMTFTFALVLGTGRLCLRSGLYGYTTALILNVPLFQAGLLPAPYGHYLTGFIGDKNVAGLVYCITGILILIVVRRQWIQVVLFAFFSYSLWLTGSRTSLAAFGCAIVWIFIAPRLAVIGRWLLGVGIYVVVNLLSEDYSQIGVFSDRVGSDLLRARIDAAAEIKTQAAGSFGTGLGEAYVVFADAPSRTWFFHNSYWTVLVEGGWPWLLVVLGITVFAVIRPFTRELSRPEIIAQAAGIALLVCALRLGEVFFTASWAMAIGAAIYARAPLHQRNAPGPDATGRGSASAGDLSAISGTGKDTWGR